MNVHFIAIGGSAMHNLAIALHLKGYVVSGSDDEIFEPSSSRLRNYGLLPASVGWFPEKIHAGLDAVILGMHARKDNPELLKATEMGLKIFSYPEFLYEQSKNKKRIVIGGSHGKTTITSMILHIVDYAGVKIDYMVGAQLEGFEVMVRLSDDATWMLMEGDEYLTSPIDPRPKFLHYRPHIALISGIGWDHVNVFPQFEDYLNQFRQFISVIEPGGTLVYNAEDQEVVALASVAECNKIAYTTHACTMANGETYVQSPAGEKKHLAVFGRHNLSNLSAALQICSLLGIDNELIYDALSSFKGASKRLELVAKSDVAALYRDFAHAPSKVKASAEALRLKFPDSQLIICLELHTFSSLSASFIDQYKGTLDAADLAVVFYDQHAVELKRLELMTDEIIQTAFGREGLFVVTTPEDLLAIIETHIQLPAVIAMMSSGSFRGIDFSKLKDLLKLS